MVFVVDFSSAEGSATSGVSGVVGSSFLAAVCVVAVFFAGAFRARDFLGSAVVASGCCDSSFFGAAFLAVVLRVRLAGAFFAVSAGASVFFSAAVASTGASSAGTSLVAVLVAGAFFAVLSVAADFFGAALRVRLAGAFFAVSAGAPAAVRAVRNSPTSAFGRVEVARLPSIPCAVSTCTSSALGTSRALASAWTRTFSPMSSIVMPAAAAASSWLVLATVLLVRARCPSIRRAHVAASHRAPVVRGPGRRIIDV